MTVLAWINNKTMICDNVSIDDRPASEIRIPDYMIIDLEQTDCMSWKYDETLKDYVLRDIGVGTGGIGFSYIDGKLVSQKPTEQPSTTGTQEL